ncbi:MAG TPA: Ig-like domain-containing protein, partial [Longimicrobium sp.]|nr:Ig-like domain-containing protein [Longimicrobium sp.]
TFSAVGTPGNPAAITPVGPVALTGTAGAALADSLAVRVTDPYGNPITGAAVVWSVRSGGGSISPLTTTTGTGGIARAAWTLGTRVDSVQVAQAAAGVSLVTEFTAQAALPLDAQVIKVSGDAQTATVGTQLPAPLKVAVRLMDGRPVVGAAVTWSTGSGTIAGTSPTDAAGEATAAWTLGTTSGGQVATASSPGATAASFTATATAGPATALQKAAGDAQSGSPGTALANPVVVRAVDAHGNAVPGVGITWTVMSGGGSVTPPTNTTGAGGTASATWTLGPATGAHTLRASSGALAPVTFSATAGSTGALTFNVRLPQPNQVVGDTVPLAVRITSPGSGISVTAQVMDRITTLVFNINEFQGTLAIGGLPKGDLMLRVRAQAANGDTGVVLVPIIHDVKPQLAVASPEWGTVARTDLRIDVDCTDEEGACTQVVVDALHNGETRLASGTTGVHATLSFAAFSGVEPRIRIRGTDARGQVTEVQREVAVWANTQWTEIGSGGELLWDVDATRALYVDSGSVGIRNLGSGAETVILPRPAGMHVNDRLVSSFGLRGYLHPTGAIFQSPASGSPVYDWRSGTLSAYGAVSGTLDSEDGWVAWSDNDSIMRAPLGGTPELVWSSFTSQSPSGIDLGEDGALAYRIRSFPDYTIYLRYADGTLAQVAQAGSEIGPPRTDGTRVVFFLGSGVVLWEAGTTTPLVGSATSGFGFDVVNGHAAYHVYDASSTLQVWVRGPDGVARQATFAGQHARMGALAEDGRVIYTSGGRMYATAAPPYTGTPVDLGLAPPQASWAGPGNPDGRLLIRNGQLLLFLGRSAFTIGF